LWSATGAVVGQGQAGPSGLSLGVAPAWQAIAEALEQACQQAGSSLAQAAPQLHLALGLAGATVGPLAQAFLAEPLAAGFGWLLLAGDGHTALLGAHRGRPGVLLAAGTGSVGEAWRADGSWATVGGWGFPVGDEGSGGWLGLRTVGLVQRALDGRAAAGPLARAALTQLGGAAAAVQAFCAQADQTAYARLAPLVFDHAAADPEASHLLQAAADALAAHARALDPTGRLPLALAGSVAQRLQPWLAPSLRERLVVAAGDPLDGGHWLLLQTERHVRGEEGGAPGAPPPAVVAAANAGLPQNTP
jgi:glucosamine kinase